MSESKGVITKVRPFLQEEIDYASNSNRTKSRVFLFTAVKLLAMIINPALYVFFTIFYYIFYCV